MALNSQQAQRLAKWREQCAFKWELRNIVLDRISNGEKRLKKFAGKEFRIIKYPQWAKRAVLKNTKENI
jgi:hypothetical protein